MKKLSKMLSVMLSLAMCAGMVAPAFAANFSELQSAIDGGAGTYGEDIVRDENNTITLNGKVTRGEGEAYIKLTQNQNVTIDLNGNTVDGGSNYAIVASKGSTLTVKDSSDEKDGSITSSNTYTVVDHGTLNLEAGTITTDAEGGRSLYVSATGTANISEDATVEGGSGTNGMGVYANGGIVNTEGTISGYYGIYGLQGAKINVTDGKITGDGTDGIYSGTDTVTKITGGSVTGTRDGIRLESRADATIDGKNTTITGTGASGQSSSGISVGKGTKLTVKNGKISGSSFGIGGNGTKGQYGNTTITVSGGKVTGSYAGIYHPQVGKLNVSGGEISGITGIEMRAGTLNISGGKVTGNYNVNGTDYAFGAEHKGGSLTTYGVGVAVSQHVTEEKIAVNISGGTLEGYYALFEKDLANADKGDVTLNITGGNLVSTVHENAEADPEHENNVTTLEYSTNDAVKVMDDYKFFATGGMSTDKIAENYLGEVDISEYETSSIKDGIGQVGCYEVKGGELPYQVGYLTATTENDTVSLSVNGTANLPLAFYLNNAAVNGTVLTDIDWSVAEDDADIVSVENGTVTALAAGEATITAKLHNGETVTFTVTVTTAPVIPDPVVVPADDPEIEIDDEAVPLAGLFTRADAIGYLWEQSGSPEWELSDFPDVPEDHYWAVAIGWAQDMGIALPDMDGNFRPDDLVLRSVESLEISPEGELQEFLNRYAVFAGIELDEGELFIELGGEWDDIVMGEDAQVIFDDFFAKLEEALADLAA